MYSGKHPGENKNRRKSDLAFLWAGVFVAVLFALLFFAKIQGVWDFSGSYGIREITSSRDRGMEQAVIDGDEKTFWGSYNPWEKKKNTDYICFSFRQERVIQRVRISGTTPDQIQFLTKENGTWREISVREEEKGVFVFDSAENVSDLKIMTAPEAEKLKWKVKEIEFYD